MGDLPQGLQAQFQGQHCARCAVYCVVVTLQIFLVYFCFNMLYHGTNVGVPLWVATVLNLVLFQMLFAYMWPQVVLLDQPL